MSSYTATVFRGEDTDRGYWLVRVPELDVVTQSRTLSAAEEMARDLVATWLDVPLDSIEVEIDYSHISPEVSAMVATAADEQSRGDELIRHAAAVRRQAAQQLVRKDGLSVRDAARVLGVTYARVQQLVS